MAEMFQDIIWTMVYGNIDSTNGYNPGPKVGKFTTNGEIVVNYGPISQVLDHQMASNLSMTTAFNTR